MSIVTRAYKVIITKQTLVLEIILGIMLTFLGYYVNLGIASNYALQMDLNASVEYIIKQNKTIESLKSDIIQISEQANKNAMAYENVTNKPNPKVKKIKIVKSKDDINENNASVTPITIGDELEWVWERYNHKYNNATITTTKK